MGGLGRTDLTLCPPAHTLQLKEVVLKSSKVVRADICVVGIGEWGGSGPLSVPRFPRLSSGEPLPSPVHKGLPWSVWKTGLGLGLPPEMAPPSCPQAFNCVPCPALGTDWFLFQ